MPAGLVTASLLLGAALGCESADAVRQAAGPPTSAGCLDSRGWRNALGRLEPASVARVDPKINVYMCRGTAQVVGTEIILRPGAVPSEERARLLACPRDRVFFAESNEVPRAAKLPVPSGWVDIGVEPVGEGIGVVLSADSVPKNIRLLRDTRAFAAGRSPRDS